MSYKAIDIARYIINHSIEKGYSITNLKLQKLLYYVQAKFLVEFKEECFEENIMNWNYGPVVESVYKEFKVNGRDNLTFQDKYTIISYDEDVNNICVKTLQYSDDFLQYEEDAKMIDDIIDAFAPCTPYSLVNKTHLEDPWKNTDRYDIIPNTLIKEYFHENKEILEG